MMAETLLDRHDAVLFDLDGTIYHGTRPIPNAAEAVAQVRDRGRPVRFVTNNASKSPDAVAKHLAGVGVSASAAEVSTSAQAGAALLRERLPDDALVLVVGTAALEAEVQAVGLRTTRKNAPEVAAVVQGHSPDTCWSDLAEACLAVRGGAWWVACNADATLPSERGQLPGNGSMVAALRTATNREPEEAGKPEAPLLRTAARSVEANSALVVGDRLDTDIAGAAAAGYRSLVVLTGVATAKRLLAAAPGERPDYPPSTWRSDIGERHRPEIGPRPVGGSPWTATLAVAAEDSGDQERVDLFATCTCGVVAGDDGAPRRASRAGTELVGTALNIA